MPDDRSTIFFSSSLFDSSLYFITDNKCRRSSLIRTQRVIGPSNRSPSVMGLTFFCETRGVSFTYTRKAGKSQEIRLRETRSTGRGIAGVRNTA